MDISNGEGIGVSLFVQGCPLHCKGCFNPSTWDFSKGFLWTEQSKKIFFRLADQHFVTRISILGGEPLCPQNIMEVTTLLQEVRKQFPNKKIWLYSGYCFESLLQRAKTALSYIDIIVDGQFVSAKADPAYPWAGSTNQRVIDVQKSLQSNTVVLYR